jgi:hypothetical protein
METEVIKAGLPNVNAGTEATPLLLMLKLPPALSFLAFSLSVDWLNEAVAINMKNRKIGFLIWFYWSK